MKQHISTSDLQQLTPSQQGKLRELWQPETGDWAIITGETLGQGKTVLITKWYPDHKQANLDFIGEDGFCSYTKENLTPLISIGQCIELLQENQWIYEIDAPLKEELNEGDFKHKDDDEWWRTERDSPNPYNWQVYRTSIGFYNSKELIDALFEAVKSIL